MVFYSGTNSFAHSFIHSLKLSGPYTMLVLGIDQSVSTILTIKELTVLWKRQRMNMCKFNTRERVLMCQKKNQDKGAWEFRVTQSFTSPISE